MTVKLDMVSKMDRSELEDKFIRMYEENLIIKRYAKKQDDKIKKLVDFFGKLVATLRGSRPGVQSASLIMTSLMTS